MNKRFLSMLLVFLCLSVLLSGSWALAESFPFTAIAGKDGANLRDQPDINSNVLMIIHSGELVTVTGRKGDWYAVSHLSKRGYVHKNMVSFFSQMVFDTAGSAAMVNPEYAGQEDGYGPEAEEGVPIKVGKGGAYLRDVMDLEAKPIRTLHAGEEIYVYTVVTVNRHYWAVVETADGTWGYVSASYLDWESDEEDD